MELVPGGNFSQWLNDELMNETLQSALTAGRPPERPVCLTEIEAVALMFLAFNTEWLFNDGLTVTTAHRLAETLHFRLDQLAGE